MSEERGYYGNRNAAKPDEEKHAVNLNIRCRADELDRWRAAADRMGMSLSEFVRSQLNAIC